MNLRSSAPAPLSGNAHSSDPSALVCKEQNLISLLLHPVTYPAEFVHLCALEKMSNSRYGTCPDVFYFRLCRIVTPFKEAGQSENAIRTSWERRDSDVKLFNSVYYLGYSNTSVTHMPIEHEINFSIHDDELIGHLSIAAAFHG